MYYYKPAWLTHGGERKDIEVYSCHISPDGSRLVTAAGDGHVRIWSVEAILNSEDPDYTKPKQLASMSYHSGTIHTVRFSSSGKFLASGADDKIVCVYAFDPSPPSHAATFGTNEAPPVENWRIFRRLIGHDNDVQDLGWSYDSSILISVGLDSKVVVWSGHTFEKLKTISNHQSHVKGLTFDPANKYFATASDDRTVKIFRFTSPGPNSTAHDQVNNFVLEKSITTHFMASPLTTYFRRCSWSPDGNLIAAANAVNGPVSSVAVLNRGTWDGDIHLIGHEGPVEVCAFSPRLFTKKRIGQPNPAPNATATPPVVTVIACAGQDKTLTIWITSNPRPLIITHELCQKSISDLAWHPDGKIIFLTSLDGTIIGVVLEEGELGQMVGMEENEKALAKFGAGRKGAGIIEGPGGAFLEDQSKEGELRGVEGRMGALMGDSAISTGTSMINTSIQAPATLTNGTATSNERNGVANGAQESTGPANSPNAQDSVDPYAAKLERLKQRVTITKDGRKRIAPLLVSSSGAGESSLPRSQLIASTGQGTGVANDVPQTILDLSKPFDGLPKGGMPSLLIGNKRKMAANEADEHGHIEKKLANASRGGATPILLNTMDGLVPADNTESQNGIMPVPEFIRPAVTNPSLLVSQVRLAVPRLRAYIGQSFGGTSKLLGSNERISENGEAASGGTSIGTQTELMFEARNPTTGSHNNPNTRLDDREPARLAVTKRGQPIWQDFLPRSVLLMTGSSDFWAVACEDGSLYVWTPGGRRLVNAMVLESQAVILESKDSWLLCVTAVGMCYVWDIKALASPHPPVSLAPVLDIAVHSLQPHTTKAVSITSARVNSEGRIIVTLSNGDGYAYSPSMFVWQRLSEVWWAVGSQYWNTADSSVGNLSTSSAARSGGPNPIHVSAGVIPYLEKATTNETLVRGRAYFLQRLIKQLLPRPGFESFESAVSIAHLENRLAAALMLGAKEEFQMHLYMYARRLGAEGLKTKVEELLRGLLGGPDDLEEDEEADEEGDRNLDGEAPTLCGWPRRDLLVGVVLILGKHRDLQRLTVPYANVLGLTDVSGGHDMAMES